MLFGNLPFALYLRNDFIKNCLMTPEFMLSRRAAMSGLITAALNAAGYTSDHIDVVVITHMHGDHIEV